MSNTLLTSSVISNELLMRFKNNLPFASGASHEYDEKFDKIGDTYNLRDSAKFTANDGADITSVIQDVTETSKPLVINKQKNVAFQFSAKDLSLTIDRFAERYLDGAAVSLANQFDVDGMTLAYQSTPNLVGTAGTTPATAEVVLLAGAKMDNNSCPVDKNRSLIVNPKSQVKLIDALKSLPESAKEIGKQYRTGRFTTALGFDWAMSQNVRTHTVGSWGTTPLVNGASQTGSTLAVDGLTTTTGTAKKGDKFTVAGCYAVNTVTGDALDELQQFTVTADATANGSGQVAALGIYPEIKATGPGKTVSALPADNAAIVFVGTASTAYPQNIAYHKHAFVYAMVPLQMPKDVHFGSRAIDPDSGLSIRMVSQYDIKTDMFITRCDIAYGWAARRPEWASVIIG
jgi:hypothetical protein